MNLRDSKIVTLFLLGAGSFLFGLVTLPLRSRVMRKAGGVSSSLLLCPGAGALLAMSLLHVLPHTRQVLAPTGEQLGISFLPELVICSGFFLLYILEELADLLLGLRPRATESVRDTGDCGEASHCHNDIQRQTEGEDEEDGNNASSYNPKYEVKLSQSTNTMFPNYHSPDSILVIQSTELKRNNSVRSPKKTKLNIENKAEPIEIERKTRSPSAIRDLLLVVSLSTHSVMEGLVVGLEQTSDHVWTLFIAVALQKFILTFCVCLELQESGVKTFIFLSYLTVVSLVSPLGTGLGIIITETEVGLDQVAVAVLQGLAGGGLLYGLLARQRLRTLPGLLQVGGLLLGFLLIMMVEIFGQPGASQSQQVLGEEEEVFYRPIPPLPPLPSLPSLPSPATVTNTTLSNVLGTDTDV